VGFTITLLEEPSEVKARNVEVRVMERGIDADSRARIAV
tara:strand:- start:207 stop:323 length:117 start_codon:yes stop_codon:yes gene_type:complete